MSFVDQILGVESGGNPYAKNPRSSATGAGQFLDATWLETLAKHRPDITGTRDQLLALRTDKDLSKQMTDAYASDNGRILSQAGHSVTPGTTYLAHFAGPGGAVSLLSADPKASAESILGPAVIAANPFLKGKSAGDVVAWADRKMGGQPAPSQPMPIAPVMPQSQQPMTAQTLAASITGQQVPQQAQQAPQQRQGSGGSFDAPITPARPLQLQPPSYSNFAAQILGEADQPLPALQQQPRRLNLAGLNAAFRTR
jgi:hypothetical protein